MWPRSRAQVGTNRTSWVPAPPLALGLFPGQLLSFCSKPVLVLLFFFRSEEALFERTEVCEQAHDSGDLIETQAPCSRGFHAVRDTTPSVTLAQALRAGYKPCPDCDAPEAVS